MTAIIACVGSTQRSIGYVRSLLEKESWEKAILVGTFLPKELEAFSPAHLQLDPGSELKALVGQARQALRGGMTGLEVALNLKYGTGKEHMALISAILKEGYGIRLVEAGPDGITEV